MGKVSLTVADRIATIVLDNPDRHNAVDAAMREQLADAYTRVEKDDSIRVAIIQGAGTRAFCAGGYIDGYLEMKAFGPGGEGPPKIPRPWQAKKPYIAAILGHALGGGFALALACDLRVAGKSARLGPTGLKLGAVQGAQTTQRLTRLIGASKALEIALLSKNMTGEEAAEIGLVQLLAEDDLVFEKANEWAHTIAEFSPWTVAMTKRLIYEGQHLPIGEAFAWEDEVALEAYRRQDALEGFSAFKERRKPKFE